MGEMIDTIRRLVERLAPAPICESCIAERLDLPHNDAVHTSLVELAIERGFDKARDHCTLCDEPKAVIRKTH